ncbi:MAG: hydroxyacid dehydrogenase [Euryarchaeota archaeon]|nr:hydroxyacid dehydrogenase [Euryarchaeota archaeon]|tara:strand:- start:3109 stop:4023 length:915 start_codon:yes stop_codon:yes gene_type:complete
MKVAISTSSFGSSDDSPIKLLEKHNIEIVRNPFGRKLTQDEIVIHLNGVDGLLAGLEPLNSYVFRKCASLKAIARVGIGMDNVDIESAEKSGIKVSNTPDGPTDAVAELTLAAALSLSRNIISSNSSMHDKIWKKSIGKSLKNANVLFIGYGRIGKRTAKLFSELGSRIFVCDPALSKSDLRSSEKLVSLDQGLQLANIITLHSSGDRLILDKEQFDKMIDGVMLLNSARGSLVDDSSLIDALESGKVGSAWMDVYSEEPYIGKLTQYSQVLLTPHISTYTVQCRREMELAAVKNLLNDLEVLQ